jgi:S1-C subfamily serine protease
MVRAPTGSGRRGALAVLLMLALVVPVQANTTLWAHNGSVVELVHDGQLRRFYYSQPRDVLLRAGVQPGTLLFDGRSTGSRYIGTAYFFNPRCGRGSYDVSGPILNNHQRVVVQGRVPRLGDDCRVRGYHTDRLEFTYLREQDNAVQANNGPNRPPPNQSAEELSGTGFFVTKASVLTNYHVIEACNTLTLSVPGMLPNFGRVVASDANNDLALVSPVGGTSNNAPMVQPSVIPSFRPRVRVGESVFAYGYPLPGLLSSSGNFTSGTVSSLTGIGDDISRIQISTPVQPGNSGGPLLDRYGNAVGVVVSKLNAARVMQATSDIPQNVNFAIKASVAISFLEANNVQVVVSPQAKQFTVQVICK